MRFLEISRWAQILATIALYRRWRRILRPLEKRKWKIAHLLQLDLQSLFKATRRRMQLSSIY